MKTVIIKTQAKWDALPEKFAELTAVHIYADPEQLLTLKRSLYRAIVSILGGTVGSIDGGTVGYIRGGTVKYIAKKKPGPPCFAGSLVINIGPIGSGGRILHAYSVASGVHIMTGCYSGSIDDFEAAVKRNHGDNEHGCAYAAAIAMIRGMRGDK
jgi:hypothetical protein